MKHFLFSFVLLALMSSSCKETQVPEDCIDNTILNFQQEAYCSTGSSVKDYLFQGETVFVLEEGNCGADFQHAVLNRNCEIIGCLGGITGNSEINGENFGNAQFVATLWTQ